MKWLEYARSLTNGKSHGRKKIKKVDANLRRELTNICDRLSVIADNVSKKDALTIFEVALCRLLTNTDQVTRDGIFAAVNNIINSSQCGKKRTLTTKEAVESYIKNEEIISTGIISRSIIDNLMDMLKDRSIDQRDRSHIYKSIILRLVGELDPDHIKDILSYDLPSIEQKKESCRDGHMYG